MIWLWPSHFDRDDRPTTHYVVHLIRSAEQFRPVEEIDK